MIQYAITLVAIAALCFWAYRRHRRTAWLQQLASEGICGVCGRNDIRDDRRFTVIRRWVPAYQCRNCYVEIDIPQREIRRRVNEARMALAMRDNWKDVQ